MMYANVPKSEFLLGANGSPMPLSEPKAADNRARRSRSRASAEQALMYVKFAVFSRDRRQQIRLAQSGLANLLMLGCVGMTHLLDACGVVVHGWVWPWTLCSVGGMVTIFALIRSGRAIRWSDPSLTMQQMYYAVLCAAMAYCFIGVERAIVIPILAVVLMFGMFGMTQRQVLAVGIYTLVMFGAASVYLTEVAEAGHLRGQEIARFIMVTIVMAGVVVLTGRLHKMRERSREQRLALTAALQRISELATRDELTGCFNRRAMLERMAEESLRCVRSDESVCVATVDLDNFKRINDKFGHGAGDLVLRGFADVVRSRLRETDLFARWGGEEFLLLFSATDLPQARTCVQRMIDQVAATRFDCLPLGTVVTCSVGIAEYRRGEGALEAVKRSDVALYEAKSGGRNQLVCA